MVVTLADGTNHDGTFIYHDPDSAAGHVLIVLDAPPDPIVRVKVVAYRADGTAQTTSTVPLSMSSGPTAVSPSTSLPAISR